MGWASGTDLIRDVWKAVRQYIPEEKRVLVLRVLMNKFEEHDWDCVEEIRNRKWPETKIVLEKFYPDE